MSNDDRIQLLRDAVAQSSQGKVAKALGVSTAAVSQILNGKYGADPSAILQRVEEVYGSSRVQCPTMGDIALGKCAETRRRPFAATNPHRVKQYRACSKCPNNTEASHE
ncbi:helix-turn-helix transcriptional regulator [uncultured Desulfuromonas sp.]|uniref:helix-turn-helix domain-containing protein n=1 Tax=uncultured Desulfuromonas sp. TaxID=181013 RepID=UPI002AAACD29|nr:helix-turn-helix transcriptional regulator [uncultured Desulfuromonas sp.]